MIPTRRWLAVLGWIALAAQVYSPTYAMATACSKPIVVIDPGHTPQAPGAISVKGIGEVVYNDHFSDLLDAALKAAGYVVRVTRQPDESISLVNRAAYANLIKGPALLIAIHHDSAQLVHLDSIETPNGSAYRTKHPLTGYSVFVSQRNEAYTASLQLAQDIGGAFLSLGRAIATHHTENIEGERRAWLDEERGVYRFDQLVVLAQTKIPAVLLELGVIVDVGDEGYVSNPARQQDMVKAIIKALDIWVVRQCKQAL